MDHPDTVGGGKVPTCKDGEGQGNRMHKTSSSIDTTNDEVIRWCKPPSKSRRTERGEA